MDFDRAATRSVPVEVRFADGLPENLKVLDATAEPSALAITGPASRVARVAAVQTDALAVKPVVGTTRYRLEAYVNDARSGFRTRRKLQLKLRSENGRSGKQLFGTDGIRGVAGQYPLDAATVHAFGRALGSDLRRASADAAVLIGMDSRESGPWIAAQVAAGLAQEEVRAVSAGVITTPGVAYLTRSGFVHGGGDDFGFA